MKARLFVCAGLLVIGGFLFTPSNPRAQQHRAHRVTRAASNSSSVYPMHEGFVDAHGVMIYYLMVGPRRGVLHRMLHHDLRRPNACCPLTITAANGGDHSSIVYRGSAADTWSSQRSFEADGTGV
jgi:hypothetical protein